MMQIDCEVLATRSIEFTEKDFKIFRPKEEVARKGNNSAQGKSLIYFKLVRFGGYTFLSLELYTYILCLL